LIKAFYIDSNLYQGETSSILNNSTTSLGISMHVGHAKKFTHRYLKFTLRSYVCSYFDVWGGGVMCFK